MAMTGTAGGPPGDNLAGPIHTITNMGDTAGAIRARGPLYLTTNATQSAGHIAGLTPIHFGISGSTWVAGDTDQSMFVAGGGEGVTGVASGGNVSRVIMPFAGSVMAISARASGALPTDTIATFAAKIGGTRQTGSMEVAFAAAGSKTYSAVTDMTSFPFSAGDELEVVYDAVATAIAKDVSAILWTL